MGCGKVRLGGVIRCRYQMAGGEGGVVGFWGGGMIFRAARVKSETTFVKQNRKLVHTCGFGFHWRGAKHVALFDLSSECEVLGPRLEKSRGFFEVFRGAPPKSDISFVSQLSILFHEGGLRFSGRASEYHTKNPTSSPCWWYASK